MLFGKSSWYYCYTIEPRDKTADEIRKGDFVDT